MNTHNLLKDSKQTSLTSSMKPRLASIDIYAVQCANCYKWRAISSQQEYEEIRCKLKEEPFVCDKQPGVSCEDPADLNYDATRTWVIDKPNLPKTPKDFDRTLVMRKDFSKLDAYYHTPTGKRLKSLSEVEAFIKSNPKYEGISISEFSFTVPKVMKETVPENALTVKKAPGSGKSSSKKKTKISKMVLH